MEKLASKLRDNAEALAEAYGNRLRDVAGYGHLPTSERIEAARYDLELIIESVKDEDPAPLVEFLEGSAGKRLGDSFAPRSLLQVLSALEETLMPQVDEAEAAKLVWRILSQARDTVSQRVVDEFRDREQLFRSLVENAHGGVFLVDDNYQFVYANERLCEILGYSRHQIIGMDFREVLDDASKELVARRYVRRRQGKDVPSRYELSVVRQDGERRRLEMRTGLVEAPGGAMRTMAQVLDITERKQVEQTLRQSEQRYRALFERVPVGLYRTTPAGEILDVNPALVDMLNYPDRETLLEATAFDLFADPDDRLQERALMEEQGIVRGLEMKMRRYTGEIIWARDTARVIEGDAGREVWQGSLVDITEQKETEQALRESEARTRALLDAIPDMMFRLDRDGTFLDFKAAREGELALPPEAFMGQKITDVLPPPVARPTMEHLAHVLDTGEPTMFEYQLPAQEGDELRDYEARMVLSGDDEVLSIIRDITAPKRMERQIRESLERRSQQVVTSTEIAQDIAAAPALDELFRRVVTLVAERFGYYHAQIFRYEPAVDAVVLVTGYGEAGEKLLAEGYRMEPGEGVIGTAVVTGESVLASDVSEFNGWVYNEHLPETQSELAVPIVWQDEVLGILDVQSETVGALTEEDQIVLEGLCGQIAIAIQNAQLRQEMEKNLGELERLTRLMSREGWEGLLREERPAAYRFEEMDVTPDDDLWVPEMALAAERQDLVSPAEAEDARAVAPLSVRGEMIGALGVQGASEHPLSPDELSLLESASEQIALALESARLFQQTQEALAEQQRLVAILETVPDLVAVADIEGRLTYLNPGGREMLGFDEQSALDNLRVRDLYLERGRQRLDEEILPTLKEEGVWQGEVMAKAQDGHQVPVLQVVVLHERADGGLEYFTVARDITDRKRVEAEREETLREMERLTRAMSREGWEEFRRERETRSYWFDRSSVVSADELWTPEIELAAEQNEAVMPKGEGQNAAAVAPLSVRGEVIGALGIQDDPERPLSLDELALVEAVSEQVASAMESARLFEQTQVARAEAETLYNVSRSLITAEEPREMLEAVAEPAFKTGARVATLFYVDTNAEGEPEWAETAAHIEASGETIPAGERYHLPDFALGGLLIASPDRPQLIPDIEQPHDGLDASSRQALRAMQARAAAVVPLTLGERWLGILTLTWPEPHPFSSQEERLYSAVAPQLATLIENQRLFERTQEALEEVEATHRLYLREQWEQFVPAQVSPIYERSRRDLQPLDGDLPREVEQAMQHGKVVVSSDGDRESALVAPLTLRGEVIGALGLQDPEGERQWTEEEQLLVESVAEQLALALENARLLEETQRRAQRDHLVADITSEVRASSDMEGILRTAVRELGTVLDVDRARIHLRTEAEELESEGETRGSTIESSTEV